jgi:phage terminase small subunit
MPELTNIRQERFCQTYAATLDIAQAEKAGKFSEKYGYELMQKHVVKARLMEIQRGTADRMVVGQNKALREACYLSFSDITEPLGCVTADDLRALPEHVRKAIQQVDFIEREMSDGSIQRTTRIKMHSKIEPLKLVAQVTGLLDTTEKDQETLAFTGISIIADIAKAKEAKQLRHQEDET